MLHEYQISNFKGFDGGAVIPIKPITLVYGQNSSGKSSILQSLLLLRQTLQEAEDTATLLLPRGNFVDLGSYSQFINQHDLEKSFSFRFSFDVVDTNEFRDNRSDFVSKYLKINPVLGLQIAFSYDIESARINFKEVDFFIGDQVKPFITYKPNLANDSQSNNLSIENQDSINFEHDFWKAWWDEFQPSFKGAVKKKVLEALEIHNVKTTKRISKNTIFNKVQELIDPLESEIEELKLEIEIIKNQVGDSIISQDEANIKIANLKQSIFDIDDKILPFNTLLELYDRFEKYNFKNASEDLSIVLAYSSFIICSQFLLNEISEWEHYLKEPKNEYLNEIYRNNKSLDPILNLTLEVSNLVKKHLDNLVYIAPLRDYPERFYILSDASNNQVGKSGKMIANVLYKRPDILDAVNRQLELFGLGYEVKITSFKDEDTSNISDVFAIGLIDKYTKVNVSLLDVGFGISQILPVIVQSMLSHDKTILIEQPEIHIHPRLQAQLGSLLAESIKSPLNNRFIIETHSEHLLLRLQKLIRKGQLSKDDVSIIYVDRDGNGSSCLQLRLDSDGDFIDEWPDGFFDESFNEMFG